MNRRAAGRGIGGHGGRQAAQGYQEHSEVAGQRPFGVITGTVEAVIRPPRSLDNFWATTPARRTRRSCLARRSRQPGRTSTPRHLAELRTAIEELIETAREHPAADGVWTTVLWTAVDREDRTAGPGEATGSEATGKE